MRTRAASIALTALALGAGCFDFEAYNRISCQPGFHQCDDGCVSNDDIATCGISCTPCPTPIDGNGRAVCDGQQCGITDCTDGYHVCGNTCVKNDINACGDTCTICPHSLVAHEASICDGASCSFACEHGFHPCGATDALACLADDSFDSCGAACSPCSLSLPPNSVGTCIAGVCGYECTPTGVSLAHAIELSVGLASDDIKLADLNNDGNEDLIHTDFVASSATIFAGKGDGTFSSALTLPTVTTSFALVTIAVGDLDSNGTTDIAIAKTDHPDTLVYLNRSVGGTFAFDAPQPYPLGGRVTIADFDGDGVLDMSSGASVARGLGDGTFAVAAALLPATGVAGDLNADGHPDLASIEGDAIAVRLGTASGSYAPAVPYPVGVNLTFLALGEVDGDGHLDLLVTRDNTVSVLLGSGDGTFAPQVDVDVGGAGYDVAGDFNGDGKIDLAGASFSLLNQSSVAAIAFAPRASYLVASVGGTRTTAGDVNNDGLSDLLVSRFFEGTVSTLLGSSKPTLQAALVTAIGARMFGTADFDHDGNRDISTPSGVALGRGDGTFGPLAAVDSVGSVYSMLVGDFNGDQHPDLVRLVNVDLLQPTPGSIAISLGQGDGTFAASAMFSAGLDPWGITAGDFDGNGTLDVVAGSAYDGAVSFLRGVGDGTFEMPMRYSMGTAALNLTAGDFDGDGSLDIASTGFGPSLDGPLRLSVARGLGDGAFSTANVLAFGNGTNMGVYWYPQALANGDLDGDGRDDVVAISNNARIYVFMGTAGGPLAAPVFYPCGDRPSSIAIVDINGDRRRDLAVGSGSIAAGSVLLGQGDGTFHFPIEFPGLISNAIVADDFDNDRAPDLAAIQDTTLGLTVLLNTQRGQCSPWSAP